MKCSYRGAMHFLPARALFKAISACYVVDVVVLFSFGEPPPWMFSWVFIGRLDLDGIFARLAFLRYTKNCGGAYGHCVML